MIWPASLSFPSLFYSLISWILVFFFKKVEHFFPNPRKLNDIQLLWTCTHTIKHLKIFFQTDNSLLSFDQGITVSEYTFFPTTWQTKVYIKLWQPCMGHDRFITPQLPFCIVNWRTNHQCTQPALCKD